MTDIAIVDDRGEATPSEQERALRVAARYARDAAELEMFAAMFGSPQPERKEEITEGEDH